MRFWPRLTRESFEALCRRHPEAMMERFAGGTLRRHTPGSSRRGDGAAGVPGLGRARLRRSRSADSSGSPRNSTDTSPPLARPRYSRRSCVTPTLGRECVTTDQLTAEDDARLVRWLGEQERANRFVVYCPDPDPTAWNALSIRQADHVVLVARGSARPRRESSGDREQRWRSDSPAHVRRPDSRGRSRPARRCGRVEHWRGRERVSRAARG